MNLSHPSVARRQTPLLRALAIGLCSALLTACAGAPARPVASKAKPSPVPVKPVAKAPAAGTSPAGAAGAGGSVAVGWSAAGGAGASAAPDLPPDPEPIAEAPIDGGPNRPYRALGRQYTPTTEDEPHVERGLASWYGKRFHGRRTASGERFDMHAMTAAHPTWPIPSYARVRSVATGREIIVRINDRGPFHTGRIIDLSYTAARKLGVDHGPSTVEVERLTAEAIRTGSWRRDGATALAAAGSAPSAAAPTGRGPAAEDHGAAVAMVAADRSLAQAERSLASSPPAAGLGAGPAVASSSASSSASPSPSPSPSPSVPALAAEPAGAPTLAPAASFTASAVESHAAAPAALFTATPSAAHSATHSATPSATISDPLTATSNAPVAAMPTATPTAMPTATPTTAPTAPATTTPTAAPTSAHATPPAPTTVAMAAVGPAATAADPAVAAPGAGATAVAGRGPSAVALGSPSAPPPAAAPAQTYWVQLAAFRQRDGADAFHRRVASADGMGWIAPWLTVATDSELHRLQAGPFTSRDEALTVAQRVRQALSLVPLVVERR